jgi:predicted helicase
MDHTSSLSIVSEENCNGIVAFVVNRSFIDSRAFGSFREIVQQEFEVAYIIDIKDRKSFKRHFLQNYPS